jgi:hypothetical protein
MNDFEKRENSKFFTIVLNSLNNNGSYVWPAIGATFTKVDGKFTGSKAHMKMMRNVTSKDFHKHINLI